MLALGLPPGVREDGKQVGTELDSRRILKSRLVPRGLCVLSEVSLRAYECPASRGRRSGTI